MYAVILAGGVGTRLWPRSRQRRPKQLLNLIGEESMLQRTVSRIRPLVPEDHILIMTGQEYTAQIAEQLPGVPQANIIAEPQARGTAPCTGLAAIHLQRSVADDIMIQLHADAYIEREDEFRDILKTGIAAAEQGHLVTVGIVPRFAETGFGYIQRGQALYPGRHPVYRVQRFTEKPDAETAQRFVESGEYYWNSGIFIWKISTLLAELERYAPELYSQLRAIQATFGRPDEAEATRRLWDPIQNQAIDTAVMEKARNVVVIPADIGWSDVGSWAAVAEALPANASGNVFQGAGRHLSLDTRDTFVYSEGRLIATIGLEGLAIVDTGDVLLICTKERAQDVKKLVDQLKKEGRTEYL